MKVGFVPAADDRAVPRRGGGVVLCAAIDIHKHVFQAVVVDAVSGEVEATRFSASRESLDDWAMRLVGHEAVIAIEATTGWRWVVRELQALGLDVRLADPGQARALQGRRRRAKTDRLDARWLALLLTRAMLPEAWIPPAEIQRLRDVTRLRKTLLEERTRWAQRLHSFLVHEGWACSRWRLLTKTGRSWVRSLRLDAHASGQSERLLRRIESLDEEIAEIDRELRLFARGDARCRALESLYGIGR